ncbi:MULTISPECIES: ABC transporter permease [Deinococcus]|uniref:Spermidine/putrescine ABC transporter permease n=2 Tax=Deinococcus soli (ex Cha et al. 2016) TaxID=1309411 RepID=A0A0F7JU28_9DEIO|nr:MULTISPECIES: ABC transporter permease [Deinococcus]AKH18153.1 spermidine/putrescine ABC transporter permease [Deinococcus soli (ex Cha et al. 2016)]MDR6217635.1 spermidine/putrescine transport system permease protein [Deinococcus soli (ex Cha et al. 2016)]MDR6326944.1 spermidine/putrescine transport system permease protein [Deinococcus soli (ex Cha et al. 2016)]MDR6750330.1 spermidine/putrescine transport system permease protein [Deinococcus soli (ex Cha et al. 2016)]
MLTVRRFFATLGPGVLWLAVFLIVPALVMLGYSFLTRTDLAQVGAPWTLESWQRVFGYDALFQEWTGDNVRVLWRSVWVATLSTALCVLMGYPLAFYIARQDARRKNLLLLLLIIPFWTNFLIRVYAWILILRPFDLVPSLTATLLGMVYAFVPFFVLPVYSSVEKIDWRLLEAAEDLGAPPVRAFLSAVFPQTLPGLVAGILLTFIPALGTFVVSDILGGAKTALVGNLIQNQFGQAGDWPYGSALSFLLMGAVLLGLWAYARVAGQKGLEELV